MANVPSRTRDPHLRFAAAIFLSSGLLFLIEPVAGKRLLPLLGGSAAVWTACLVFFQLALLAGYLLAHGLVTRAAPRTQGRVFLALLALSFVQLVVAGRADPHADTAHPIASVLGLLTLLIGLPFVTLSAASPLLQAWHARATNSRDDALHDEPSASAATYRLYAVSNVGSLLALVAYPWLVEPVLSIHEQSAVLAAGIAVLAAVAATIALRLREDAAASRTLDAPSVAPAGAEPIGVGAPILWVLLAACGSLLLSAVTNHLSQNVATIPLLWVLPLIAYLSSFVVAFHGERWRPRWLLVVLCVAGLAGAGYLVYQGDLYASVPAVVATFCGALFVICLFCHAELYRRRPAPARLTTFYFCLAAGGAVGAIAVGIVAPYVLTGTYELAFGLSLAAALAFVVTWTSGWIARVFWIAATGALAAVLISEVRVDRTDALVRERNFYGTLHVTQFFDLDYHAPERTLYNGVIAHGQEVYRTDLMDQPTTYYGRTSGIGLAIERCCGTRPRRIGVIGLGTGTIAAYGAPGDTIRFYDINPAVIGVARRYFSYLHDTRAHVDVVLGDARLSLAAESPQRFDVLAVDAFSGDAIPVHLLTSEALALYERQVRPGGIIAFHVSNRFLDLAPVVAQLARHAGLGTAFISTDDDTPHDVFGSDWVLVTADQRFLNDSVVAKASEPITVPPRLRRWTDDYNSLLPVLRLHSSGSD